MLEVYRVEGGGGGREGEVKGVHTGQFLNSILNFQFLNSLSTTGSVKGEGETADRKAEAKEELGKRKKKNKKRRTMLKATGTYTSRNQRSEVRSQKSGVRNQESRIRYQASHQAFRPFSIIVVIGEPEDLADQIRPRQSKTSIRSIEGKGYNQYQKKKTKESTQESGREQKGRDTADHHHPHHPSPTLRIAPWDVSNSTTLIAPLVPPSSPRAPIGIKNLLLASCCGCTTHLHPFVYAVEVRSSKKVDEQGVCNQQI